MEVDYAFTLLADVPEQVGNAEQVHHNAQPQQRRLVGIQENRGTRQPNDRKHIGQVVRISLVGVTLVLAA